MNYSYLIFCCFYFHFDQIYHTVFTPVDGIHDFNTVPPNCATGFRIHDFNTVPQNCHWIQNT